jgi:hypothetical protein
LSEPFSTIIDGLIAFEDLLEFINQQMVFGPARLGMGFMHPVITEFRQPANDSGVVAPLLAFQL